MDKAEVYQELNKTEMMEIMGGGPIVEFVVWLYAYKAGQYGELSSQGWFDEDTDWDKIRVLYGG